MKSVVLPYRPRLAETAAIRRYRRDGEWSFSLHDERSGTVWPIEQRLAMMLTHCDGTRDLGGILLACSRSGVYQRASAIEAQLSELHQRGLLADGLAARAPKQQQQARPLEALPAYQFTCSIETG